MVKATTFTNGQWFINFPFRTFPRNAYLKVLLNQI